MSEEDRASIERLQQASRLRQLERLPDTDRLAPLATDARSGSAFAEWNNPDVEIDRMMNANMTAIDGVPLLPLLDAVAETDGVPDEVRAQAASFAVHRRATGH